MTIRTLGFTPLFLFLALILAFPASAQSGGEISHAMAMGGEPKYPAGFSHFDYVNPDAPKGGLLRQSDIGTYDSFNPFIVKGVPASGLGLIYDTLTVKSDDEPFTEYGLLAEKIEMPADRSWVVFHLNPKARFHDGMPVSAADVAYTFELLTTQGDPLYRKYYADVTKVEVLDEKRVKFHFKPGVNRELPLIIGQMQVLPEHYWKGRDFSKSGLEVPFGSGPYLIKEFDPGRSVTYERNDKYWARDHPVNKGQYNYDRIRYDYYRDGTVAMQAFLAGEYDFRQENISKQWASAYTGPAVEKGLIKKEVIPHENTQGMQGFVFNTRREMFKDPRVREALAYAFNFEWSNKNLFNGQYKRSKSYFSNSELASSGLPSKEELEVLEPFRRYLPEEVFTKEYQPPATDGSGDIRDNLRTALALLKDAGWELKDRKLVNSKTGTPLSFEMLLYESSFERVVLPFKKNLERIGIELNIRFVDTSQYINRMRDFDFDMAVLVFGQSLSPGNEQRNFWHSSSAQAPGSSNYAGVSNPGIDGLVDLVISAPDRKSLVTRTRALDRALLWGYYVIPHWHLGAYRVAFWDKFDRPAVSPKFALGINTWWVDKDKEKRLIEFSPKFREQSE